MKQIGFSVCCVFCFLVGGNLRAQGGIISPFETEAVVIDELEINEFWPPLGWQIESLGDPGGLWRVQVYRDDYYAYCQGVDDVSISERLMSPIYNFSTYDRISVKFDMDFDNYSSTARSTFSLQWWTQAR